MDTEAYDNFSWLTSNSAAEYLSTAISHFEKNINPLKTAKLLRKSLPPDRAAIVMEQAQLRIRARKKFDSADQMFFTGRSLEQSTSQRISRYKAQRFSQFDSVVDICCGIGGDLISLANRSESCRTVGVDQDPVACCFAQANLNAVGVSGDTNVSCKEFESLDLESFAGVHIDPDRRVKGRTVKGCFFEPQLNKVFRRVDYSEKLLAIKVAPATVIDDIPRPHCREWVGTIRECKEQVLWLGPNASSASKLATVVSKGGSTYHYRSETDSPTTQDLTYADGIESFIYEPHATVLAAGLGGNMATENNLKILARGIAYFTSDNVVADLWPMLKGYRVEKVLPADLKQIHKELQNRETGQLIIKKRGVDNVLAEKVKRLKLTGDQRTTIILTRLKKSRRAIIVTKISQ